MNKIVDEIFKLYSPKFDKLVEFGFKKKNNEYFYEKTILGGQFELKFKTDSLGKIEAKVFDAQFGDEYILFLFDDIGEFAIKVRNEYEKTLIEIRDVCFEKEVFKSEQAKQIIEYIRKKYGDELEFLWEKFSDNAIWRRKDNKKWYGLLVVLSKRKLGLNSDEISDIIDLRIEPDKIDEIVDNKFYFKGYHMNKKHWITIPLDSSVTTKTIFNLIDRSYELANK